MEIGEQSKVRGGTGGGGENAKMDEQLATLALKVVPVTGDGNCFFRSICFLLVVIVVFNHHIMHGVYPSWNHCRVDSEMERLPV